MTVMNRVEFASLVRKQLSLIMAEKVTKNVLLLMLPFCFFNVTRSMVKTCRTVLQCYYNQALAKLLIPITGYFWRVRTAET